MGVCWTAWRSIAALVITTGVLTSCASGPVPVTATPSLPVPPPAVSGIDHTVTVTWQLADSFDTLADGTCAGRGENHGMRDGARIRLQGNGTGFVDETTATARFERRTLSPKQALGDDGRYCVLRAVFAPESPDPVGYSITFPGTRVSWGNLGISGGTPFGRADDPPGYGSLNLGSQLCRSLLDPPDEECPELAD